MGDVGGAYIRVRVVVMSGRSWLMEPSQGWDALSTLYIFPAMTFPVREGRSGKRGFSFLFHKQRRICKWRSSSNDIRGLRFFLYQTQFPRSEWIAIGSSRLRFPSRRAWLVGHRSPWICKHLFLSRLNMFSIVMRTVDVVVEHGRNVKATGMGKTVAHCRVEIFVVQAIPILIQSKNI